MHGVTTKINLGVFSFLIVGCIILKITCHSIVDFVGVVLFSYQ